VPSGGIGGDMTFYYKEPKAGNLWVFALDAKSPVIDSGSDLVMSNNSIDAAGRWGDFEPTESLRLAVGRDVLAKLGVRFLYQVIALVVVVHDHPIHTRFLDWSRQTAPRTG
jgi:hypothetical protein